MYRLLSYLMDMSSVLLGAARTAATEEVHRMTATIAQRADRLAGLLSRVPHNVAEIILAGFLMPLTTRRLTTDETSHARKAFGTHAIPLAAKTRISYGPGRNPIAMGAFLNGNPAITIGNALYFQPSYWKPEFAAS